MDGMGLRRFSLPPGGAGEVEVLFFRLDGGHDLAPLLASLDAMERQHALERKDRIKARYIRAHGGLRHILGAAAYKPPEQIVYVRNRYGKPAVEDGGMFFNMSHSGKFCLVGLSRGHALGVDVQCHVPVDDMGALAMEVFSSEECRLLDGTPPGRRRAAFFDMWARKEALLKYIGTGMTGQPRDWTVLPRGRREADALYMARKAFPVRIHYGSVHGIFSWGVAWGLLHTTGQ
ncbi:MAG TPA: 4'-phosphopantetheinyl transferase superfamily protein [Solidesulfovibrio sp.]|nr:4'-phosphopantetheinyl transferase superfamily protein [Solidesulfovibrio sp.]